MKKWLGASEQPRSESQVKKFDKWQYDSGRRVSAIYSFTGFIYSESTTYLIRGIWQNKIPRVLPEVVKIVRKLAGFPGFP